MNPRDRLLKRAARGEDIREEAARLFAQKLATKRAKTKRLSPRKAPGRAAAKASREERNERTAEVRAAVWRRMNPWGYVAAACDCGCTRLVTRETFHMDHWIGGSSRRSMTTAENCWGLHPDCDDDKTNMGGPGRGSVETWNAKRQDFCEARGLPFIPRKPTRYAAPRPPHPSPAREETTP